MTTDVQIAEVLQVPMTLPHVSEMPLPGSTAMPEASPGQILTLP